MAVTLQERQKFYDELIKSPSGYQNELQNLVAFEEETKFSELYRELGSVGIIKNGIDGTLQKRYSVTELGKEQIQSFLRVYNFWLLGRWNML